MEPKEPKEPKELKEPLKLPTDKYYIILRDDSWKAVKIVHNSFINDESPHLWKSRVWNITKSTITADKIKDKRYLNLNGYSTIIIGEFNSFNEAKIYIRKKRVEWLEQGVTKRSHNFGLHDESDPKRYKYFKAQYDSWIGELKKLQIWRTKYANLYPEYFV